MNEEEEILMPNPPVDVQKFGQSIWYDNIQRQLLEDGSFQKLIDESGVLGVTSNPSIFQKAIGNSEDYDSSIKSMTDLAAEEIYENLAIADIQQAAELLRPVYDQTDALDGYVSLEVSPELAHETEATLAAAKRLFKAIDRPNVMIKIPATPAGLPAITGAIAAGINVNVTLIFSIENYLAVAEAYVQGLEQRLEAGGDVSKIASVASFFISRIDAAVEKILSDNSPLKGKAAIASARLAYQEFKGIFYGERFLKLREAGAHVQRPLWASTSTKNPTYPDTLYLDTLIGAETVNTVPPNTLVAFKDHGKAESATILDDVDDAKKTFEQLPAAGVNLAQVTQKLQDDGVVSFANAFKELLAQVEAKRVALKS
jgi:transaldolase